ncbi:MAG TPA: PQQ-dependent dehydrogenase, methanol/ethanol family, partial [Steroidobacteraceae bacterium]|nr:PQQ-dependent dehydrogenase, methanol/ethanol family [Steroidobacteraceae bacterium]
MSTPTWKLVPILLALGATAQAAMPANVNAKRMRDPVALADNWMTVGGTYEEQHFSPLKQINAANVGQLGLKWYADYDTNLSQDGTPLEIDGVIYVSTAWSKVYAFDARTGRKLWEYDPRTPGTWIRNVCCGIVNRGIAAWDGKIYVGTLDGRLVAINARTGEPAWTVMTIDQTKHYSITSAPRVARGRVLIGVSGGEYGVRGYVSAYDAETGKLDWRFYTVPGDPAKGFENAAMKMAAKTWGGQWWKLGGGGTTWDALVYDPVTDLIYVGVGNGTPWNDHYRDPTTGDDLFLASIVALKPDTGEYVWHYQETPADTWDYDAVSPLSVVDMRIGGRTRRVLLQPSKNGFFYVIDARRGTLLKATPFVDVNWADGVDMRTGRPRVRPEARYPEGSGGFDLFPGVQGAHGWHSNAYSPLTGLMYVPTQLAYFPMVYDPSYTPSATGYNLGIDFGAQFTYYHSHPAAKSGFTGYLQAWDPRTGRQVWGTDQNQGPTGGAVATAGGLVFQGNGLGKQFRAFDAATGRVLWSFDAQTAVLAAPISYQLDGRQYVAVSVGGAASDYYAPNYSR